MKSKESAYRLPDELKVYTQLNRKSNYLLSLILLVFILGIITYAEKFDFWADPLSVLGEIYPQKTNSNMLAFGIFLSGMLLCSLISFSISQGLKDIYGHKLFKLTGTGFILLAFPSNHLSWLHSLGGALTVGSLWWFCVTILNDLFKRSGKIKIIIYHILLQGTVLPYAFLYFAGVPGRQAAQKFAVLGLILVLKFTTSELLHYHEKKKEK